MSNSFFHGKTRELDLAGESVSSQFSARKSGPVAVVVLVAVGEAAAKILILCLCLILLSVRSHRRKAATAAGVEAADTVQSSSRRLQAVLPDASTSSASTV
ncbi:sialic acid-binding Ig-like lectin 13 [Piliocolobus tephrosceles]|uniref:sialic acid-binding Ig-like lectin 13 n=1 Tax=Piliocolobus tephrosceles TaxID=591936 RepID=UPI000E6B07A5|nr:sialic acid-binding Ig-like lectin 13 [Piliocolobus tephrosceles]